MLRSWVKALLFFSSFAPLFFIVLIQQVDLSFPNVSHASTSVSPFSLVFDHRILLTNWVLALAMLILCVVPNIMIGILFAVRKKKSSAIRNVEQVSSKASEVLGYMVAYLLPFLAFNLNDLNGIVSFAIMLVVIAIVYIDADILHVNPSIWILFRYKIVEVVDNSGDKFILIGRKLPTRSTKVRVHNVYGDVWIEGAETR